MSASSEDRQIEVLLAEVKPRFRMVLARFRIPPQDADDVVQDVLVQYWRKRGSIKTPEHWLPVALRLQCLMYIRTRGRSRIVAVDESILDLLADADAPVQERKVLRNEIEELIGELKWQCRELLKLRYRLGLDNREIASKMDYKPSSIDTTARRCIDDLTRLIAKRGLGGLVEGGDNGH